MNTHALARTGASAVDDLRERLARFREVDRARFDGDDRDDSDDARGIDRALLHRLIDRWRGGYDWTAHEERIAGWPWMQTTRAAVPVRAVVAPGPARAPVVLLLHGWPDSVLRFERLLPRLAHLTVVAPALPGFPFAAPVEGGGLSSVEMADAVAAAMTEFGFDRFVVSAGDVGCDVAEALAARHPEAVSALHLTDVSQYHFRADLPADLTAEERAYVERGHAWQAAEGGYMHEQSTRPHTLAVGLGDSPAALAAWIGEKLVRWTDSDGELIRAFSVDEALTWISAYWFSGAIGTSFAPYASSVSKDWPAVSAPTVFTVFPRDLVNAPRHFAERFFEVVEWREFERGGHFAAWECPDDYLWGIERAVAVAAAR